MRLLRNSLSTLDTPLILAKTDTNRMFSPNWHNGPNRNMIIVPKRNEALVSTAQRLKIKSTCRISISPFPPRINALIENPLRWKRLCPLNIPWSCFRVKNCWQKTCTLRLKDNKGWTAESDFHKKCWDGCARSYNSQYFRMQKKLGVNDKGLSCRCGK